MMDGDKGIVEEGEIHDDENDDSREDKDVPDNFFDDFNNEGFMESLQIVDSLDDTNLEDDIEEDEVDKEEQRISSPKISKRSIERNKVKRSQERGKRSRSRERKRRSGSPRRKRKFDNTALRRDPTKTKRDLERDRENFFKKKEQKVISKIVETGLVPPGMESEVNLKVIESESSKEVEKNDSIIKYNENDIRSRDQKPSKERRSNISKERRRRSRSRSYGRFRSRSRERRIERSRSRGKRIERGRDNRKSFEKYPISRSRDRSRDRGRVYEHNVYSPTHIRRRRSRSPSDRERWLSERNRSPEWKYQGMIREKKMSFLEEIKMKLNGDNCSGRDMVTYPFPKNPVQPKFPDLVPPESSVTQYNHNYLVGDHSAPPVNSSYNEDFFIGNQPTGQMHPSVAPIHLNVPPMHPNMASMHPNMAPMHANGGVQMMLGEGLDQPMVDGYSSSIAPVPPPSAHAEISNKVSELMARISASTNPNYNQKGNNSQVNKRWSFTDCLHLNPTTEFSSDSEALKKKVDVLSRCQDFLKELSGDKKFSGKLKITKNNQLQKGEQNVSPLVRQRTVKFLFSTSLSENSYQDTLNRTLIKLGAVPEIIDLINDEKEDNFPPVLPVKRKKVPFDLKSEAPKASMYMKMCQTDPIKCEDCETRKAVQYKSIGIQCGESERYNVGVQVVEEDIVNYRIPKNQSLAYLTPAQLLGRSDPVVTRADNYGVSSSMERPDQHAYRDGLDWNRPRDPYEEIERGYQGSSYYGAGRDSRYTRY